MLLVFFATDQLHRPRRFAKIYPMSQQDATATRPYRGLVLDIRVKMKRLKILCILKDLTHQKLLKIGKFLTEVFEK